MSLIGTIAATAALSVFDKAGKLFAHAGAALDDRSLVEITKGARVEPLVLVDTDVLYYEGISDILQSLQNQFAGYYLQAVALSGNVGKVSIMQELDRLNPNRDSTFSNMNASWMNSMESYKDRLPVPFTEAALENADNKQLSATDRARMHYALEMDQKAMQAISKDIQEASNLSTGKILNVEFRDPNNSKNSVTIPVVLRLMVHSVASQRLTHILSLGAEEDMSAKDRYYAWRAGKLEFVKDIILATDKIEAAKQRLLMEKDDLYANIVSRANKNRFAAAVSGKASIGAASGIAVFSADTANMIENKMLGELRNTRTRQKIWDNTSLMIMVVVDKEWDKITFYYRGINESNTLDIRSVKSSAKGGGGDVSDILKAFIQGNSPRL